MSELIHKERPPKKVLKTFLQLLFELKGMQFDLWDYNQKRDDARSYEITQVLGGKGSRIVLPRREFLGGRRYNTDIPSITLEDLRGYVLNLDGKRIEILNRDHILNLHDAIIGYDENLD